MNEEMGASLCESLLCDDRLPHCMSDGEAHWQITTIFDLRVTFFNKGFNGRVVAVHRPKSSALCGRYKMCWDGWSYLLFSWLCFCCCCYCCHLFGHVCVHLKIKKLHSAEQAHSSFPFTFQVVFVCTLISINCPWTKKSVKRTELNWTNMKKKSVRACVCVRDRLRRNYNVGKTLYSRFSEHFRETSCQSRCWLFLSEATTAIC